MTEWNSGKLASIIFLIALTFYIYTMAPVVTFVDSGELAAVVGTRGISHPTGFPLYSLLTSLVAAIPVGTLIRRLNSFSALCAAISVAMTYLIFQKILKDVSSKKRKTKSKSIGLPLVEMAWVGSSAAGFAWMTNRALWSTATVTEVYALHAMLLTIFCFSLISYSRSIEPASTKYLALAFLIAGLGISNYPPFAILAPAVLFYLYKKRPASMKWKNMLWMFGLFAGGLLPYILLPIRANSDPLLNWGNPSSWELFWKHVSAAQYKIFLGKPNFAHLSDAILLWWDQWPVPIWLLMVSGIVFIFRMRRDEFYLTFIIGITNILYVLSYDIVDVSSAPSDYYAYLLPLCCVSSIWIGAGVQWIVVTIQKLSINPQIVRTMSIVLLIGIPVGTAVAFWGQSNRRQYVYADDFARSILVSLPRNSLVLTHDWTFVSPALYLQHIEQVRPDVVVLDTELLRRSWYFKYVKKVAPWLVQSNERQISAFVTELAKYESGIPYDANLITEKYVAMINGFVSSSLYNQHPAHILLNLEAKEADPQTFREWERSLGRPPFITLGVMPNAIGAGYQWVPESLAFRLYADNKIHSLQPITVPPRSIDQSREYDPVTRGVFARYAEFWRWRGDYLRSRQNCTDAIESYEHARQILPELKEVSEGLSVCVETLLTNEQ